MIPPQIYLSPSAYNDLLSILRWEQSMPAVMDNYLGDRFGEWMWEAERDHIPVELEDWEYICHVELRDDHIFVVIGTENGEDTTVPIWIKQE